MARTNSAAVIDILGRDYDTLNTPSLTGRIDSATAVVDRVSTCASNKGVTLSTTELELIERWLAAHFYTKSDPVYQSKSTAGASGSFVRGKNQPEPYKDGAINMDYSGCLKAILERQTAGMTWLGTTPQTEVDPSET